MTPRAKRIRAWAAAALVLALLRAVAAPAAASCPPPAPAPPEAGQRPGLMAKAHDRGALWRIRKDGRVSYLYATIHLGRPEWMFPGPRVQQALRATDVLALELDPLDPALPARARDYLQGLPPLELGAALQQRLARQRRQACTDDPATASLHPVLQTTALIANSARHAGLYADYGLDVFLAGFARSVKRPTVALETIELQMALLIPARLDDQRAKVDSELQELEQGKAAPLTQRLAELWADGRMDELDRYEAWCDCVKTEADRTELRQLLDDRNPGMAERIDALHAGGQRVFAAVGMLHMAGPKGLPALLAARGFEVERVRFDAGPAPARP